MIKLVVASLLLVVAAGCSDPEPVEPSASPTPTVTVPTMPAQAKENTPEGAAAFAIHFVNVLSESIVSSSSGEILNLSSDQCKNCNAYAAIAQQDQSSGREVVGFQWTVSSVEIDDDVARLRVDARAYKTRDSADKPWSTIGAAQHQLDLQLEYVESAWLVNDMFTEGPSA